MDDLKLIAKSEEEFQKQIKKLKTSVMIFVWKLDLKIVPSLHLKEANYFTRKIW